MWVGFSDAQALDPPSIGAAAKGPNQINLTWSSVDRHGYGFKMEIRSKEDSRYKDWTPLRPGNGKDHLPYWVTEPQYRDPTDAAVGDGTFCQFPVFGLRNNTEYEFRVRTFARNDGGREIYSDYSNIVSARTRNYSARYVRPDGDDRMDGRTPATAWKHIYKAGDTLKAGQVAIVFGGDYPDDYLIPRNSGKYGVDNKIVFMANPGDRVNIISHGGKYSPNIHLTRSYTVVDGINPAESNKGAVATIRLGSPNAPDVAGRNAIVNIESGTRGSNLIYSSYNLVQGVFIHDTGSVHGPGTDPSSLTLFGKNAHHNVIQNSVFRRGEHDTGLLKNGAAYNKWLNNLHDGGWGSGINIVSDNGTACRFNLIEGNEIVEVGRNFRSSGFLKATSIYKTGIQISGDLNTVRRCIIRECNDGRGFNRNLAHAVEISRLSGSGSRNNLIYNNVLYHNGGKGIVLFGPDQSGNIIANNIIYYNSEYVQEGGKNCTIRFMGNFSATEVHHNLILFRNSKGDDPDREIISFYPDTVHDRVRTTSYANKHYPGFRNNFCFPPDFISERAADFHLKSTSKAINAGRQIQDPFWGTVVYKGTAPDIGAFEYSGAP